MLITFRLGHAQLSYDDMCNQLLTFSRDFMQSEEEQTLYTKLSSATTINHSTSNQVNLSTSNTQPIIKIDPLWYLIFNTHQGDVTTVERSAICIISARLTPHAFDVTLLSARSAIVYAVHRVRSYSR